MSISLPNHNSLPYSQTPRLYKSTVLVPELNCFCEVIIIKGNANLNNEMFPERVLYIKLLFFPHFQTDAVLGR